MIYTINSTKRTIVLTVLSQTADSVNPEETWQKIFIRDTVKECEKNLFSPALTALPVTKF